MPTTRTSSQSSTGSSKYAAQLAQFGGPKPTQAQVRKYKDTYRKSLKEISQNQDKKKNPKIQLPVAVDPNEEDLLSKDFNSIVKKNPHLDTVQRFAGKTSAGLSSAVNATGEIFSSLAGVSKLGLKKSTSNPTATTVIAGGGSVVAALLSAKSLINTFKQWMNPKTGSWLLSALQSIVQGGVAVGLGAPFLGKGEKSPFIKKVDGQDIVEMKSLLGGVGFSALIGSFIMLSENRLPGISRVPIIGNLLGGITRDIRNGIDAVTKGEGIAQNQVGLPPLAPGIDQAQQYGLAA